MTFAPRIVYGDLDLTDVPFMVEFGFDLGHAVTLYDVLTSLMVDGSLAYSPGSGNRESLQFSVITEAPDSSGSADASVLLEAEASRSFNTLTFYPGDGYGAASVLETFPAQVTHDWDQDLEQQGLRRYVLLIPALPFARSVDPVTINWTGGGTEVSVLKADWTTAGTSAGTGISSTGTATVSKTITASEYVWVKVTGDSFDSGTVVHHVTNVKVNGVSIPDAKISKNAAAPTAHFYTIPTEGLRGESMLLEFAIVKASGGSSITLAEVWTVRYPNATSDPATTRPRGVDVIDVVGSARTPCTISFTAPAGGAFVYTAPDPNAAIRGRGVGESVYAKFTVTGTSGAEVSVGDQLMWFPPGDHTTNVGTTVSQPLELFPDGVWPSESTGAADFGVDVDAGAAQWAYPIDAKAAISFFSSTGAKTLISPSPDLPQGYHGDAVTHEQHTLHPPLSGFGVFKTDGDPIATTITYYPRYPHHAAQ